jgi:hypothetical protein
MNVALDVIGTCQADERSSLSILTIAHREFSPSLWSQNKSEPWLPYEQRQLVLHDHWMLVGRALHISKASGGRKWRGLNGLAGLLMDETCDNEV